MAFCAKHAKVVAAPAGDPLISAVEAKSIMTQRAAEFQFPSVAEDEEVVNNEAGTAQSAGSIDTPHSRHTHLRRYYSETIFSRVCSVVSSLPEPSDTVIEMRTGRILRRGDVFTTRDQPRVLPRSVAVMVQRRCASGVIAKGLASDAAAPQPVAGDRPAALAEDGASRGERRDGGRSRIPFLLRNLRKAPAYVPGSLTVIAPVPSTTRDLRDVAPGNIADQSAAAPSSLQGKGKAIASVQPRVRGNPTSASRWGVILAHLHRRIKRTLSDVEQEEHLGLGSTFGTKRGARTKRVAADVAAERRSMALLWDRLFVNTGMLHAPPEADKSSEGEEAGKTTTLTARTRTAAVGGAGCARASPVAAGTAAVHSFNNAPTLSAGACAGAVSGRTNLPVLAAGSSSAAVSGDATTPVLSAGSGDAVLRGAARTPASEARSAADAGVGRDAVGQVRAAGEGAEDGTGAWAKRSRTSGERCEHTDGGHAAPAQVKVERLDGVVGGPPCLGAHGGGGAPGSPKGQGTAAREFDENEIIVIDDSE